MDSHNNLPKLTEFNYQEYFEKSVDTRTQDWKTKVTLTKEGIKLVGQYYTDKYQIPNLNIIDANEWDLSSRFDNFIKQINSEEFSKIRKTEGDVRVPFIITGSHSTPIVYIKENNREAFLVLDTGFLGPQSFIVFDTNFLKTKEGEVIPQLEIYAVNEIRQRDNYSCHTDALVLIRELTGRDTSGNFLLPNFLVTLDEKNKQKKIEFKSEVDEDLHESLKERDELEKQIGFKKLKRVALPDKLTITAQRQQFIDAQHPDKNATVHMHQDQPETHEMFIKRYPPDEIDPDRQRTPDVSSYMREKGLKLTHIIEIQFYLNQLKNILGNKFTETVRTNFIKDAKIEFQLHGHSFLSAEGKKRLYDLAQKYLEKNLDLSATNLATPDQIINSTAKPQK